MHVRPSLRAVGTPQLPSAIDIDDVEIQEELQELEAVSRTLEQHTHAASTRRAYGQAWRSFSTFCEEYGLSSLPAHPDTVRWYVAWLSTQHDEQGLPRYAVATIRQRLAGIADQHLRNGHLDPTGHRAVTDLLRGLAKLRATRPVRRRPLLLDDVQRIITRMEHDVYPAGVSAARDALALWLGFAGALRRSEAARLRMESVELHPEDGAILRVGASKADQANLEPDLVVLPFGRTPASCAPCALHRWVALVQVSERGSTHAGVMVGANARQELMHLLFSYQLEEHVCGATGAPGLITSADLTGPHPLLRATYRNQHSARIHPGGISGDALHAMLLTRMIEAGLDPTEYGFHSLRAGHVTQARRNGASTEEIMRAGRWRKAETVNVYDREYNPAARNSVQRLGL